VTGNRDQSSVGVRRTTTAEERETEMPTKDRLTRSQIADLLNVPPLFVSDEGEANGMEPVFSDADVLRLAIVRELLGALETWEARDVFDHLRK
jgi:hypothetical protein